MYSFSCTHRLLLTKVRRNVRCAFINFKDRFSAERAAEAWASGLDFDGERVAVKWGRSRAGAKAAAGPGGTAPAPVQVAAVAGPPSNGDDSDDD